MTGSVAETVYGTLPRSLSQRRQKRRKRSEEEFAALLAHHIAFDSDEKIAVSVLLACRLYTKPLLLLKKLRTIWELESRNEPLWNGTGGSSSVPLPHEFGTIRRRTSGRSNKSAKHKRSGKKSSGDVKYLDYILDEINELTDKLNSDNFMKEFATELDDATKRHEISFRSSRDSGFASSWCSETSTSDELWNDETLTPAQKRIAIVLQHWVARSPSTFRDEIIQKSLTSFFRHLSSWKCISKADVSQILSKLNAQLLASYQFCQRIQRNKHFSSGVNLSALSTSKTALVQHLHWMDANLMRGLTLDDIIHQILDEEVSLPSWTRATKHFNNLTSNAIHTVVNCSKTSDAARKIEFLAEVGLESMAAGNLNGAMAIALALDSKPVARLAKVWRKLAEAHIVFRLKLLANPASNFEYYRSCLSDGAIPYLTLVAKDIYWLTRMNTHAAHEDMLTIEKRCQIVSQYVSPSNPVSPNPADCAPCGSGAGKPCKVLSGLCSLKTVSEDELYYLSYKLEQPNSSFEKEDFRKIKTHRRKSQNLRSHLLTWAR